MSVSDYLTGKILTSLLEMINRVYSLHGTNNLEQQLTLVTLRTFRKLVGLTKEHQL